MEEREREESEKDNGKRYIERERYKQSERERGIHYKH